MVIPELVIVAVGFYRDPRRFANLVDPGRPLPAGISDLLAAPTSVFSESQIEESAAILNASVNECRESVLFFVKQVLIDTGDDYYRTLGLASDAPAAQIKQHYRYLIRLFHPDRDADKDSWDDFYAPRINEAYNTLRNAEKRTEYDRLLAKRSQSSENRQGNLSVPRSGQAAYVAQPQATKYRQHRPQASKASSAWKVIVGLLIFVVIGFIMLVLSDSEQPVLRIEAGKGDGAKLKATQADAGIRQEVRSKSTETELDSAIAGEHADWGGLKQVKQNKKLDALDPVDQKNQSTEALVQQRVAQATAVMLEESEPVSPDRSPARVSIRESTPENASASVPAITRVNEPVDSPAIKPEAVNDNDSEVMPVIAPTHLLVAGNTSLPVKQVAPALPAEFERSQQAGLRLEIVKEEAYEPAINNRRSVAAGSDSRGQMQTSYTRDPGPERETIQASTTSLISNERVFLLLTVMMSSYEKGDIDRFMSLFTENAWTQDARGKAAIYNYYSALFSRPEQRKMIIEKLQWEDKGGRAKLGSGELSLVTIPHNEAISPTRSTHAIEIGVLLRFGKLKINRLFY